MPRIVIKEGEGVGRDHTLGAGECVVGRDPSVDFVIEDGSASRRHFRIFQEEGSYWVEDLESTNGTRINGRKAKRWKLKDGDEVRVGGTKMAFVQKDMLGGGAAPTRAKKQFNAPVRKKRRR